MKLKPMSLRSRVYTVAGLLVLLALLGGVVTLCSVYRIGNTLTPMLDNHVVALNDAQELETALVMQKGFLTYYFLDRDPQWLDRLNTYRQNFESCLRRARETAFTLDQRSILNDVESRYIRYAVARDEVADLYKQGKWEEGLEIHRKVRDDFYAIRDLCENYKTIHQQSIDKARQRIRSDVAFLNTVAFLAIPCAVVLGVILFHTLLHRILTPIRRMATGEEGAAPEKDEVVALSRRMSSLIADVDQTQSALQLSREHLLQAEKLAMVGKLAAGVAHSVRNPLTSVKMRLFSLERSLELNPNQREDLEVISEEIRHIDAIVRNFLEFSRRPKLKLQEVSLSDVVDLAIQLLKHRLEAYGVEVELYRQRALPLTEGDPEQLKEVLVNLMVNACEAMPGGGLIKIMEEVGVADPVKPVVVVRISDNGPGVPESIQEQVFQPFFSTKEEGTGLGLSIAARIVEDHHGILKLKSRPGKGATFTITLPCKEERAWLRS